MMIFEVCIRVWKLTCWLWDYLQKLGLFSAKQSPELPKIIPTLRPLKVEIIFGVWDDFWAPTGP